MSSFSKYRQKQKKEILKTAKKEANHIETTIDNFLQDKDTNIEEVKKDDSKSISIKPANDFYEAEIIDDEEDEVLHTIDIPLPDFLKDK